jgi:hypothetical protein
LHDHKIKWATGNFLKVSFLAASPLAVPVILLGWSLPQALLANVGVSLVASAALYNVDRRKMLRENPFSYVLSAQADFKRATAMFRRIGR